MIIKGVKSIKNVESYIKTLKQNELYILGLKINPEIEKKLNLLGFSDTFAVGDHLLPDIKNGPTSRKNSLGDYNLRRDLPKEDHSYTIGRNIEDWHGNTHYVLITRHIKRIARDIIEAPEIELLISSNNNKEMFVISNQTVTIGKSDPYVIKHIINLFLELFGSVEFFKKDLEIEQNTRSIKLRWEVLPKGEIPWEQKEEYINKIVSLSPKGEKSIIKDRLIEVEKLNPDFRAYGLHGYRGYVIYGFENKKTYLFESAFYGNATYIIEGDWESISRLSKAEIIKSNLCKSRLIHQKNWKENLKKAIQ
ncbi:hypothetical protein [Fictibacillus enclensis]|uniref:hypothetical protein n=1 Tax=Fictibacillus enclensis TaxID=1017270 RepID=UPI0024BF58F6|nr:hypothetical protein [Fictibacillus enclensis]WHY73439.1 hypothetical protein QNH15_05875 [Fictibacillus enclensis]